MELVFKKLGISRVSNYMCWIDNTLLYFLQMVDAATKKTLGAIPLLKTKAGPREKELWVQRLKEEYHSLIQVLVIIFLYDTLMKCN